MTIIVLRIYFSEDTTKTTYRFVHNVSIQMIRKKTVKEGKINFKKNKMDFTGVVTPTRIHIVTDLGGGERISQRKKQLKTKSKP